MGSSEHIVIVNLATSPVVVSSDSLSKLQIVVVYLSPVLCRGAVHTEKLLVSSANLSEAPRAVWRKHRKEYTYGTWEP